jgi:hypothetical protein
MFGKQGTDHDCAIKPVVQAGSYGASQLSTVSLDTLENSPTLSVTRVSPKDKA